VDRASPLTFTALLYSVVIGLAFQRIDELRITEANVLMVIALVLIFDDYLLYTLEIPTIAASDFELFWWDIAALAIWYGLVLTTPEGVAPFFLVAGLFYALTSTWKAIYLGGKKPIRAFLSEFSVGGVALALAAANALFGAASTVCIIVFAAFFLGHRLLFVYPPLWRQKSSREPPLTSS
jgi:hypothetical protein